MLIFKIILISLLLLEVILAVAIKYNQDGIQDKLISWFCSNDVEDYIRNKFPNTLLMNTIILLILVLLAC